MANIWSRIKARLSWLRIKSFARNHKIASVIIVLIIIFAGYKIYGYFTNTSGEPRYVIAAVNKGTIISTISGAGQVSASNQLDITNKVSGDLVYLGVTAGQKVSAGTLIAQIDARDAQANLESAQIALSKLQKPADKLSLVQAQNALASALNAETKAYSDGFSAVDTTFLDLPDIMTGLDNLFNNYNASTYFTHDWALSDAAKADRQKALASYSRALAAYNHNLTDYHGASRTSASSTIQALVEETAQTARLVTQALKDTNSAVAYVIDQTDVSKRTSTMTTDTSNLNTWTNTMNANVTSLNNLADTIDSSTR
ncbi:MAG: biotin/lipoyl-binding protein, partial [Candidatus Paceibacterota bacterium]